jgi:hypothetical protein
MNEKPLWEQLSKAKEAVCRLLNNEAGSVDMHGLAYWASEVERLRAEIKKTL